jgi:hypothetical protein
MRKFAASSLPAVLGKEGLVMNRVARQVSNCSAAL